MHFTRNILRNLPPFAAVATRLAAVCCVVAVFGLAVLGLVGCAGHGAGLGTGPGSSIPGTSGVVSGKPRYAMVAKLAGNPYFREVCAGAKQAAEELGVGFTCQGPEKQDAATQARLVGQLLQDHIQGLAIAADDGLTLSRVGKKARKAGLSVVSFDSQVDEDARTLHIRPAQHSLLSFDLLHLAQMVGGPHATIAILAGGPKASDQKKLVRRLLNLMERPPFLGLRCLNVVYGYDTFQQSYDEAADLINANPDLQVLVCTTPMGLQAAAKAAQDSLRLVNKTAVIGVGAAPSVIQAVHEGTVPWVIYWPPHDLGYLTLYALNAVYTGQTDGHAGQTFRAGCLGTFRVEEDGFVIMGRPQIYDWENIDSLNLRSSRRSCSLPGEQDSSHASTPNLPQQ
ncbi:MAG: substrate-binding domain-containing protein [Desulfovibrio sp.]|uniref:substrate-binding domain-containing protein n=1 Tax=Desulfovibrio sp. 7SRBS1 TaxID=3378064 RepID=UPI003B3DB659